MKERSNLELKSITPSANHYVKNYKCVDKNPHFIMSFNPKDIRINQGANISKNWRNNNISSDFNSLKIKKFLKEIF